MNVEGEIIINSFKTHTFKALLFDSFQKIGLVYIPTSINIIENNWNKI